MRGAPERRLTPAAALIAGGLLTAAIALATALTWPAASRPAERLLDALTGPAPGDSGGTAVAESGR